MKLIDYQNIHIMDTGQTNYEEQLLDYFKIDKNQPLPKITLELEKCIAINGVEIKTNTLLLGNKRYYIEKDFLECTYEQYSRLDQLLADEDVIPNLHKILAIYVRPFNPLKWSIEKYDIKKQDKIATELQQLDMGVVQGLLSFFFQKGLKSTKNINIHFLNQKKAKNTQDHIKSK